MMIAARTRRVGFAIDGVAMLETDARYAGHSPAEAKTRYEDLRCRVAAIPGVQSAVLTQGLPMRSTGSSLLVVEGVGLTAGQFVAAARIWAEPVTSIRCGSLSGMAGRLTNGIARTRRASR